MCTFHDWEADVPFSGRLDGLFCAPSMRGHGPREQPVNSSCRRPGRVRPANRPQIDSARRSFLLALPQLVKREIDYWSRVKRQDLRNDQPTHDSDPKRLAQFTPDAHSDGERQRAEHRGHRCHHDRTEANETRLVDRFFGTQSFVSLSVEREIDHHDRVLFHDADKQDNSDDRDEIQLIAGYQHG